VRLFDHPDFDNHEQVLFCHDEEIGLKGIIAIHSTALGPAAGGCRMHPYATENDALTDVLRLSKGMSYKNAVAGLPLGGGKCVIIADPTQANKAQLLHRFADHIQSMNGRYWTAIDVGVGPEDADIMAEKCDFIFARASQYEPGFNPSWFTALGGFVGITAVTEHVWGKADVKGLRVGIQGLGATGYELARRLHEAGASLYVSDTQDTLVRKAVADFTAVVVEPDRIHSADVDIFTPCAMGAILNDLTLPQIKAKAICGLANNQLAQSCHGLELSKKGIAYVPDYVVNAGGMMGASTVIFEEPEREASIARIKDLHTTILSILDQAKVSGIPSSDVADNLAVERMTAVGKKQESN